MIFLFRFLHFTKNFLAQLAIVSLVLEQFIFISTATAQTLPITPDGSTNTQITQTASGVDQVNIAAPNANGMSHNKFTDYNVNAGGQIINNFSGAGAAAGSGANAVTETQIGGLVTANSNLVNSGSAKVILNEVTSGNISQLLGYTEIAGTKADLILANPNGIACHGCGFINTARLLIVAGSSNFDASGNLGFNLKEQVNPNLYVPLVTIDGLGLDVTRTTGTDIIASSVKLLSSIYGSDSNSLTIKTGEGRYDYATKNITGTNIQNNTDPVFAIDASSLAGIQAGQVYLIATKQGVGVKMESEILASQTLNLDANGDIYYKSISVGDTATLRSSGTIQTSDSNSSIFAPTINITANQFNNSGLASAYNLNIQNSGTLNNSGNLEALNLNLSNITNINNSGSIFGQKSLSISGANLTNNSSGSIYSPQDYAITLTGLLTNAGLITSTNNLALNSNQLNNSGEVSAQNNLTFSVTDSATNSGNLIAGNTLNFTANSFSNSSITQSDSDSIFNLSSLTNAANSSIYSGNALNINVENTLKNSGQISATTDLTITGNSIISNYSKILANGDLNISANSLRSGSYGMVSLLDGISVDINSPDFGSNSDAIISSLTKSLNLSLNNNLQNLGELSSSDALTISSPNFANFGNIIGSKNLNLSASLNLFNSGNIQSSQDASINTASLYNSGLINSLQSATINADKIDNQSDGVISTTNDLTLAATSISNLGAISSENNFILNSLSLSNSGSIYSKNNFSITNTSDLTNSGTFYSDGSLAISSNNITNNSSAWIFGNKDISLTSNLDFTNAGNVSGATDLALIIGRNSNNSGSIIGNQLSFISSGDITNSGSIGSENNITLSATNLTNSGLIQSVGNSNIALTNNLNNQAGSLFYSGKNLNFSSSGSLTNAGEISAVDSATFNIASLINSNSILANNNFTINATSIQNQSTGTIASINKSLTLNLSDYLTNAGEISAKENLTLANLSDNSALNSLNNSGDISFDLLAGGLKVNNFTNSGNISSNQDLTITSADSFNNSGSVSSQNNFTINSKNIFSNAGAILATQNLNLNLTTDSITNSGEISASNNLSIINSGDITNLNKLLSNGSLSISANNLTNNSNAAITSLANTLTLTLANDLQNSGELSSATNLITDSKNFINSGNVLSANNLTLTTTDSLTNSGNLQSAKDFSLTTASLDNSGSIKSFENSTINTNSITNSADALIFSANDATIDADSITNSGSILSAAKLDLTIGKISNDGEIFSASDLQLTTHDLLTNSGSISSLANLNLLSTSSIINSSEILSSGNLTITAVNLTNSNKIQSDKNLTLNLQNLTNEENIASTEIFTINATGDVVNNSSLQSANNITINAANFTNAASSLVLAGKDLTIKSTTITNADTKPSNSSITSGLVSVNGNIIIQADSLNNNSGIIAAKSTTLNALNNFSVILANTLGSFISTASISLDLGDIDYTITGEVTANNVDITANNITNLGNVTANDFIKLNATGSSATGNGNITNGQAGANNSNVKLSAGSYLTAIANRFITNYGTIGSNTDLTLTSNYSEIQNYGSITGGDGITTLNSVNADNGNFNNYAGAKLTANNNLSINAKDLNNFGEISVRNDLTTNVSNNLNNNPTALIWSGRDSIFNVANNFINNQAAIYSDRNLTIQKNLSGEKTNLVQNVSGSIETYNGSGIIKAITLENKRSSMKTQGADFVYGSKVVGGGNKHCRRFRGCRRDPYIYANLWGADVYGAASTQSSITSGNLLTIDVSNTFLNDTSVISSSSNMEINANVFNNISRSFRSYRQDQYDNTETFLASIKSGGSMSGTVSSQINNNTIAQNTSVGSAAYQARSTTINKIDNYTLAQTGILNLDLSGIVSAISSNNVASNGSELNLSKNNSAANSLGAITTKDLTKNNITNPNSESNNSTISSSESNINSSTLSATNSETIFSGSFKINLNGSPNQPLVEARSQFTDVTKFFGSIYYFNQLGIDGSTVLADIDRQTRQTGNPTKLLGDAFVESHLIISQLKTLTSDSLLLSKTTTDSNQQIKELLDNSIAELKRLGLNVENVAMNGLTKDQINSLQKDIITFETTKVNGINVLAPKIYLAADTRNRLSGDGSSTNNGNLASASTIFAKDNLTIDSSFNSPGADLTNNGSIVSGGDLTLNLASLTNKTNSLSQAQIKSGGNLSITAVNDIKNIGSNITSSNNINLISRKGSILSTAIVQTNDLNLLNSKLDSYQLARMDSARSGGNITSTLLSSASIKGKDVSISAANDVTNLAANVEATNLKITAGDDINIGTLQLRNRTETRWGGKKKGGMSITDTTTNIGSDINSSGSITFTANGSGVDSETSGNLQGSNVQITGSNIAATDNIDVTAKDDVVIQAAQNTSYAESQSWKKGMTVAKSSVSGSESTTNVLSTLTSTGGNISLTSGSDTNIIGAKLKADDVAINAGNEINIYSVSDKNSSFASSSKSRNFSSVTGGLVGAAVLNVYPQLTLLGLSGVVAAHYGLDTNNSSKTSSQTQEKTSNLSSVIQATGDVTLASNQDLTISGSDVSGKTGSLTSDQGNVNILSAIETEKTTSSNKSVERATNVPGFKGSKKSSDETTETITNVASNLTFTDSFAINTSGNSTNLDQPSNINIKGSNVTVTDGDLTLASKGDITIENAIDSTSKDSSSNKRNESTKSIQKAVDYIERAVSSNLNANNINIQSRGDTLIQGSNINTKENLLIGSFAIAQNPDGTYQKDSGGNYLTTSGSTVDNLTIKNADLKEYHYAQSGKGYVGVAGAAMRALPYALAPLQVASSVAKDYMSTYYPDFMEDFVMKATPLGWSMTAIDKAGDKLGAIRINSETETRTDKTTSYASNINVGGSMMTNSVGNTLIQGSNLNVNGDLLANSLGNFTVAASQNTESTESQSSYETVGKFHSEYQSTKLNYRAGVTKEFASEGSESDSTTLTSSNINIGGSALVNSSDQFALLASNFITTGSTEIISKNNLNISDAQNTQSTSSYLDKLTLDTGVQVGNAYADAAYAIVDAAKAQKAVKDAYDKLEKIEDLRDQDMASSKAVERAKYQVVLALINAGLSSAAAMQAVGNAGAAASTSFGTGFYGSVYADITKLKSTTTSEYAQSIASNLISGDNLSLTSGTGDINITGSNVSSQNGDLNLTAMLGNLNVKAGESTYSQSSKMRSQNLGGSVGNNGFSANIGFNEAESSFDQTTFTNSQLTAENGTLRINTAKDANVVGANLLAKDINLDIGRNLLLKSKQNLAESDSYSIGMSLGISGDSSGANGGSVGFNLGNGYSNRAWVDQLTSIVGTNSVAINTANNTDIVGAMIANKDSNGNDLGNLTLNTKSLTFSDLKNFSVSESNNLGINLSAGKNPNNPTAIGSLAINLSMQGSESSSNTKATIGKGGININSAAASEEQLAGLNRDTANVEANKKTVITSDFDASIKIDLRLLAAAGNLMVGNTTGASANWNSYAQETARGTNITYDALAIPLTSLGKTIVGNISASDALLATGKNYQNLYQLAYNPNIVVTDLAGEGKLLTYNGDQLDQGAHARYAEGFYDRNSDTAAINIDSNLTDSQLAGTAAHEGGHRLFNNNGQSYTNSEESAAHMIGDFAQSRWNAYQADNTSFRASVPNSTLNFNSNFYANNVKFGNDVNPFVDTAWDVANVALGSASLYKNLQDRNYKDAAVDGVGLAVDTVSLVTPFLPGGASTAIKGARAADKTVDGTKAVEKIENIGEGSTAIVTSGKGNKGPDFIVKPNGEIYPATFTRYGNSSVHPISDAKSGLLQSKPDGTYVMLGNTKGADDSIVMQGKLQIPYRPDYSVSGNTIDVIDNISIPKGQWGNANYLEPITKDFKNFGPGGISQGVIEGKIPVDPSTIKKLP